MFEYDPRLSASDCQLATAAASGRGTSHRSISRRRAHEVERGAGGQASEVPGEWPAAERNQPRRVGDPARVDEVQDDERLVTGEVDRVRVRESLQCGRSKTIATSSTAPNPSPAGRMRTTRRRERAAGRGGYRDGAVTPDRDRVRCASASRLSPLPCESFSSTSKRRSQPRRRVDRAAAVGRHPAGVVRTSTVPVSARHPRAVTPSGDVSDNLRESVDDSTPTARGAGQRDDGRVGVADLEVGDVSAGRVARHGFGD
jgi:hypothetical protein